jgi:hypothetical protein
MESPWLLKPGTSKFLPDAFLLLDRGECLAGQPGEGLNFSFQRSASPCLRALRFAAGWRIPRLKGSAPASRRSQRTVNAGDADIELRRYSLARHALGGEAAHVVALGHRRRRTALVLALAFCLGDTLALALKHQ